MPTKALYNLHIYIDADDIKDAFIVFYYRFLNKMLQYLKRIHLFLYNELFRVRETLWNMVLYVKQNYTKLVVCSRSECYRVYNHSSKSVSWREQGGGRPSFIKIGYSEPTRAESREGSSGAESSRAWRNDDSGDVILGSDWLPKVLPKAETSRFNVLRYGAESIY